MPTLNDLLARGQIAPLKFSMTAAETASVIGQHDGEYRFENAIIVKHGPFQLGFTNGRLDMFTWLIGDSGKSSFQITGGVIKPTTSIEEFLNDCDRFGIAWTINQGLTFDRQLAIATCPNVVVFFDLDRRELRKIVISKGV